MATDFRIVIPARYASLRLPGKPLRDINGKPMIEWVYLAACRAEASEVVVATDDQRIADAVAGFGGSACLTDSAHRSGTDRILEVTQKLNWSADTIVVNLQGDEPLMPSVNISQVAQLLARRDCDMATLHKPIDADAAADPNLVKLVLDKDGRALYFSRSVIPYDRSGESDRYLGHIGIYAYRVGFIETFSALPPSDLELAESLEQLRALSNAYSIYSELAEANPGPGIDTEQDLARVTEIMTRKPA
jgi:3-deoxy-manno-octulosonate cytidylyltransferase (CMP-KDO synthetase)